ncbi:MAG: MG2 domain-containing protein, partial [Gemmataceae bacterium]
AGGYFAGLRPTDVDLFVLGQGDLLAGASGTVRVRVADSRGTTALAGVPVLVELLGIGETVTLARAETDAHGSAAPRFDVPAWADGRYRLRVTAATPRGTEALALPVQLKRSSRVMLSTDKPVYQPGQTIHLRSLALRRPDLKPVADAPAVLTLTDPRGNVLFKHAAKSSRFGLASADCPLAAEIAEGAYTVGCRVGDAESKLTVEVKRYVLPKFKLDATPDRPYYAPGEAATLGVKAAYFFGKPVAGTVTARLGDRTETAALNADGTAKLKFQAPRAEGPARFVVEVTDSAGQKQAVAVERAVTARPIRLHLLPEGGSLVRGVAQSLYLLALRADGRPVANAAVELLGEGLPARVTTDDSGAAVVPVTPAGPLGVTMTLLDAGGQPIARDNAQLRCDRGPGDHLVRPDRATYRAGDTMTLTALGGGVEPVFVDILRDSQVLRSEVIEINGTLTIDLPPEAAGTLRLVTYRFLTGGFPERRERVVHVAPADGLTVNATLDAAEYRPGQDAVLRVAVTDAKGRPVPGAVSVCAVDEAVYAVQAQRPGLEQAFFLLEQELLKPVYAIYPWSPEDPAPRRDAAAFAATAKAAGPAPLGGRTFEAKKQETDGLKRRRLNQVVRAWLALLITALLGAYGMLFAYLPARPLVGWTVVSFLGLFVIGGLVVSSSQQTRDAARFAAVGMVAPTSAARELFMVKSGEKRFREASLADSDAPAAPRLRSHFPETLLWKPELITDDQGRIAPLTVPLADSITTWRLTASAVSGDGRLGATARPIKVFQPFFADMDLPPYLTRGDEVAVPVVVYSYLDRPQTVSLKLEAGDGFTLTGKAEQEVALGAGEVRSVRYPVRVTKAGAYKLRVTARAADIADAIEREVTVEPGGTRVEAAFNGTLSAPAAHVLSVPADAIEGGTRAFVKVYPSGFSQLVEGLDAIFRLPSGCFEQTSSTTYPNVLALRYLKTAGKAAPAVEAKARQYIHLGYQRLVGFEVPGGGFDWFGRPPANVTLTAYGLMEFEDMAKVHDVDPALIDRTRRWLLAQRKADGGWEPASGMLHEDPTGGNAQLARLAATAYVAWAVFRDGQAAHDARPTREFLLAKPAAEVTDPHTLALVCLALGGMNAPEEAAYLDALAALAHQEGGRAHWKKGAGRTTFHAGGGWADVETTALAALALRKRSPDLTRQALTWLVTKKDAAGTWGSTQATVLSLQALIAGQAGGEPAERRIRLTVGGHAEDVTIAADQGDVLKVIDVSRHLKPGDNRVTLTEATKTGATYQVAFRHHVLGAKKAEKGPLSIDLAYDRTTLSVNETVRATATVTNHQAEAAPMVMVELPVPPGFDAEGFEALVASKAVARFQVRPRSVLVYLIGLEAGKTLKLKYTLRARLAVRAEAGPGMVYE